MGRIRLGGRGWLDRRFSRGGILIIILMMEPWGLRI